MDSLEQSGHSTLVSALHLPRTLHVVEELLHTTTGVLDLLHLREGVEPVGDVGHQRTLIGLGNVAHILNIEQLGDTDLGMSDIESQLHVSTMIRLVEGVVVDEIGTVDIEEGAEGQTVIPAAAEIADVDFVIARCLALTP